jgi:hypothetical protein
MNKDDLVSKAMKLLRAIPSEKRSQQSRINGKAGGYWAQKRNIGKPRNSMI